MTQHADEMEILALIERWSQAVQAQDRAGIRADHDDDILLFDVPPPFQSRGIDAYMATWELFFSTSDTFSLSEVEVNAGAEIALVTAIGGCVATDQRGRREPVVFRLTMGLRKRDGRWRITHEHHSIPAA